MTTYEAPKGAHIINALNVAKALAATAPELKVEMAFNGTQFTVHYDSNIMDVYYVWMYKRECERLSA